MILSWLISDATNPKSVIDFLNAGGILGLLVVILYGGLRKNPWWVPGWLYRDSMRAFGEMRDEKDAWRQTALKSSEITTQAFDDMRRRAPGN